MLYHGQDTIDRSEAFHCLEIGFILKQKARVVTVIIDRKRVLKSIRDRINARIFNQVHSRSFQTFIEKERSISSCF